NIHITEYNRNDNNALTTTNTQDNAVIRKPLSFGEKIALMTK
ncbi:20308_t:CDS:1, partial [Dentiscutata erythropus]